MNLNIKVKIKDNYSFYMDETCPEYEFNRESCNYSIIGFINNGSLICAIVNDGRGSMMPIPLKMLKLI